MLTNLVSKKDSSATELKMRFSDEKWESGPYF